jgi:hypothetical protein
VGRCDRDAGRRACLWGRCRHRRRGGVILHLLRALSHDALPRPFTVGGGPVGGAKGVGAGLSRTPCSAGTVCPARAVACTSARRGPWSSSSGAWPRAAAPPHVASRVDLVNGFIGPERCCEDGAKSRRSAPVALGRSVGRLAPGGAAPPRRRVCVRPAVAEGAGVDAAGPSLGARQAGPSRRGTPGASWETRGGVRRRGAGARGRGRARGGGRHRGGRAPAAPASSDGRGAGRHAGRRGAARVGPAGRAARPPHGPRRTVRGR